MSYVYFIRPVGRTGPVKIGHSEFPMARLSALMTWAPEPLELICRIPGGRDLELNLHQCFAHCYSHREWFKPDEAMLTAIDQIAAGVPVAVAVDLTKRQPFQRTMRKVPEDDKIHRSYSQRLGRLVIKANKDSERVMHHLPPDIKDILHWWGTDEGKRMPSPPSEADFARMDEVLREPLAHLVRTPAPWRVNKKAA